MSTRKPKRGKNGGVRPGAGRPPSNVPRVNLQALVPTALVEQIDAEAVRTGVSRSRYVVLAVEERLSRMQLGAQIGAESDNPSPPNAALRELLSVPLTRSQGDAAHSGRGKHSPPSAGGKLQP